MKPTKSGKKAEADDVGAYGSFSILSVRQAEVDDYREILVRSAKRTNNDYFLKKYDDCWDRWRKDHGN